MERSSERVQVLIPGPQLGGDSWGEQWREPGVTSPGTVLVDADLTETFTDDTAMVCIDGQCRRIHEGTGTLEYRRLSDITHLAIRQLGQQVNNWTTDSDPGVAKIANAIKAAVTNTGRAAVLTDLVQLVNTNPNADLRRLAALTVAVMVAHEGIEL